MTDQKLYGLCLKCGRSHARPNRLRLVKPMVDALSAAEIRDAWPCFYPQGRKSGEVARKLFRDIALIRAGAR